MLPGFRFLFAAIVLSMSILVFGFGAAALLRTAHEEFASTPSWQPAPETRFAPSPQPSEPVLAMLRVDDAPQGAPKDTPAPQDTPKDTPKDMSKAADQPASNTAPADQTATGAAEPQAEPEKIATLQPANSSPPEVAKETTKPEARMPDAPAAENRPPAEAAADAPAATDATKIAATEQSLTPINQTAPAAPAEAVPATPEQASAPNPADANSISTRIATLGGPPVTIEQPQAKPESAKPSSAKSDSRAVKKHQHARRELRRRRIGARARLVQQTTQRLDPFGQPTIATTTR
jgi:hypothetical protein